MTVALIGRGVVLGVVLTGVLVAAMRSRMIDVFTNSRGFEATAERLERAIATTGWTMPDSQRLHESLDEANLPFPRRVHLITLCAPRHAAGVLTDNRHVACLMPCTFAVNERDEGAVQVSKLNSALIGQVFGGSIRRVMGSSVADMERTLLRRAVRAS